MTTRKPNIFRATCLLLPGLLIVTLAYASSPVITEELESVIIIGSAEHPDPVLIIVQNLERQGLLKDVIVMESFPVQIKLTGPKSLIKQLQDMPRKDSPDFQ